MPVIIGIGFIVVHPSAGMVESGGVLREILG